MMIAPLRSSLVAAASSGALRRTCTASTFRRGAMMVPSSSSSSSSTRLMTGLRFASTKRYTTDHEYVVLDSDTNIGTVGITDYAQKALGDVVFVELPAQDSEVTQGDSIGAVESVKAASDIYAPISGVVVSVNEALDGQSSLLNKSPEQDGWLCKIKLSAPAQFDELLSEEAYKAHCESD